MKIVNLFYISGSLKLKIRQFVKMKGNRKERGRDKDFTISYEQNFLWIYNAISFKLIIL